MHPAGHPIGFANRSKSPTKSKKPSPNLPAACAEQSRTTSNEAARLPLTHLSLVQLETDATGASSEELRW